MDTTHNGDDQVIQPLPDRNAVASIRKALRKNPRDLLLFDLATQTGLGMKVLLAYKVRDLQGLEVGDNLPKAGQFSHKACNPVMNRVVHESFNRYVKINQPAPDDYLFRSRKGDGPLSLSSTSHLVRKWFNAVGLDNLSGAKSLKKTWAALFQPALQDDQTADPTDILKPVATSTIQERVYQELYRNIISGRIAPGETLITDRIATQMQVSPMPVREAIHRLQAVGFVSVFKKKGIVVNELSAHNLEEITKIRLTLEPMAARKAALKRSDKSVLRLESLHDEFVESTERYDVEQFLSINRKFHSTIYGEADMPILLQIINGLWDRISPYLHILMREKIVDDSLWTVKAHTGMLSAIKNRDPKQAERFVKADLSKAADKLKEMFWRYSSSS